MRVVFMGTPHFAALILENIAQHHHIVGVFTRPDAVRGRGKKLLGSPVKDLALKEGFAVYTPRTLRNEAIQKELASLMPDVICVAAYGALLPPEVLALPSYGCLNVHASLLPRWRGAAPLERAVLAGDTDTGVCIMRMEEGLDTGPYCVCRTTLVGNKTLEQLSDELADLGSQALLSALIYLADKQVVWIDQDDAQATYAKKIEKTELYLHPEDSVDLVLRKVRASSKAHPSRAKLAGKPVTIIQLKHAEEKRNLRPGELCLVNKKVLLGVRDGSVEVQVLRPDGKQDMDAYSFALGIQGIKNHQTMWEEKGE